MRKIAKSKQMKFLDAFHQLCSELGGVEGSKDTGCFSFETKGGSVTAHADVCSIYTIFGRFEDGQKAAVAFGYKQIGEREVFGKKYRVFDDRYRSLCAYTGKWNFHCSDADTTLNAFRGELSVILLSKEVAS